MSATPLGGHGGTMPEGLYRLFRSRFPRDLDTTFLEREDGGRISYGELDRASARQSRLFSELGLRKGDRVAVQVDKSPEAIVLYLAVLRSGAVYVPLNPAYTAAEISYFLGDAEPVLAVCRPEAEPLFRDLCAERRIAHLLTLDAGAGGTLMERSRTQPADAPAVALEANDLAAILYTSGTTGRSKGAMLTHRNLSSNGITLRDLWGFREDDVLLHALPIFHAHGLFVALHCVLLSGARLLFCPRFDAEAVIGLLPRATVLMGVPTFYTRMLARADLTRERCRGMRLFVSGSAPLLAETHRRFRERTGHAILERYGMTETLMITSNPLEGDRVPGSVGPALPGVEVRAVGAGGAILGREEVGVLEVRGPNVFAGYWRMPDKTRAEFRSDGFFVTGDLGRIDDRGYVALVGRSKDLIISGGLNVYPKEVEAVIDRLPGVVESTVVGVPHPDLGEAVVAVVRREAGGEEPSEEAIVRAAKTDLAGYKVPKRVVFAEDLPRNAMGKIQKNLLKDRLRDLFVGAR